MKIANTEPPKVETNEPKKRATILLICLGLLIGCVIVGYQSSKKMTEMNAKLTDQKLTIASLEDEIAELTAALPEDDTLSSTAEESETNVAGLSSERTKQDDERMETFLKTLLTWSDYNAYESARNMLVTEYGITEDNVLLSKFMPAVSEDTFGSSNMKYKKLASYVTEINEGNYSYFTLVTVAAKDANGNEASGDVGFMYTTDENGTISNLSAYTLMP